MSHITVDETPRPRMMLSVAEVAAELGCGRDTVYTLLASGQLPSVLVGERLRRIRRPDLERYIEGLPTSPVTDNR
ncbi:MAG TPA: helix-turn-helix domain-containing protein [Cellulomonas sp.]|jgi:excisionase family DNA binding protein|nr:helix-turn-helix domain-containing protein [Cellulomonas sp.]